MMHFSLGGNGAKRVLHEFSRVALYGNQIANGAGTRSGNQIKTQTGSFVHTI